MPAPRPPAIPVAEEVEEFARFGIRAFTTGREAGSFATAGDESVGAVMGRWDALRAMLAGGGGRLATARQVHGARVIQHRGDWEGWLRGGDGDGHFALTRGTAMAVSVADCVPVFLAHPGGAAAVLHSGWRGTEARIVDVAIAALAQHGLPPAEILLHLGPAICGRCYEVSADVYARLTGRSVDRPTPVDLRALIAGHARALGVRHLSISPLCTRCDNPRLYSHRCGDAGRQLGVVQAPLP